MNYATMRQLMATGALLGALMISGPASAQVAKDYFTEDEGDITDIPNDLSLDRNNASAPVFASGPVLLGFEGISQYDGAAFARNFIPPDTNGAVGATQYLEVSNGSYSVFSKANGAQLSLTSDVAFWAAAGQTGTSGDSRVMYNAAAGRWIVAAFGANTADIQIAISNTSDALGPWQSVKFTGFAGGTADYPTLALDKNAVYIGTNNFKVGCNANFPTQNRLCGTTLDVIPLNSLFNAAAPTVANMKQFVTPYDATSMTNQDRGFALQGVNSSSAGPGNIIAASLFFEDSLGYKVNGLTASSANAAILGGVNYLNEATFTGPQAARQPSAAIAANQRVIDALDERISSSVYEANGLIYMVHTEQNAAGGDYDVVHYVVMNASNYQIVSEGNIGQVGYDFYQGSIAVNAFGEVVIGYNRSGLSATDGKIRFYAQTFLTDASGKLVSNGDPLLLKESLTDDYHNGSIFGNPAVGRQRWGDYSQVSIDPTDPHTFWLIGEFAREYNRPEDGHPNGTGGSRWSTWIASISLTAAVPESSTWSMMIAGFGMVGFAMRRRRYNVRSVTFG